MQANMFQNDGNLLQVNVEVALFNEDGIWIAYCPSLEVSSYGDDKDEAKQAFEEALQIFLKETNRKGTLEKYLLKLGWRLQQKPKPVYNQPSYTLQDNNKLFKKSPLIYNEKITIPVS